MKIGICIADTAEYPAVSKWFEKKGGKETPFFTNPGNYLKTAVCGKEVEIYSVVTGIGKVDGAIGAFYLANTCDCDVVFNTGYSGGVAGVYPGQVIIGKTFMEHDFDLTPLGLKPCEKPGQDYIFNSNETLVNAAKNAIEGSVVCSMVTGDCFVSSNSLRDRLAKMFNGPVTCDMETAAMAYACRITGKEFLSVRLISDSADDGSASQYRSSLFSEGTNLFPKIIEIALEVIVKNA